MQSSFHFAAYYLVTSLIWAVCCQQQITTVDDDGRSDECGVSVYDKDVGAAAGRIVGGRYAYLAEFPWMAKLDIRSGGQNYICGGSLINNQWILTAAHCFKLPSPIARLNITLGQLNVSDSSEPGIQKRTANSASVFIHPNFTSNPGVGSLDMDYTLVKLDQPVTFSPYVRAICLPTTCDAPGEAGADQKIKIDGCNIQVSSAGWGFTEASAFSKKLKTVSLAISNREDCRSANGISSIGAAQICAGSADSGQDTCKGDSGGPLMCKLGSNRTFIVGIVSYGGVQCGEEGVPAVYSRVCKALEWIKTTIAAGNFSSPSSSPITSRQTTPSLITNTKAATTTTRTNSSPTQCRVRAIEHGQYYLDGKQLAASQTVSNNKNVELLCNDGFILNQDVAIFYACQNGRWSPELPSSVCTEDIGPSDGEAVVSLLCTVPTIDDGFWTSDGIPIDYESSVGSSSEVVIECYDNPSPSPSKVLCRNGSWFPPISSITCVQPSRTTPATTKPPQQTGGDEGTTLCGPNEIACATGGACFRLSDACDNYPDCLDGTDENSC